MHGTVPVDDAGVKRAEYWCTDQPAKHTDTGCGVIVDHNKPEIMYKEAGLDAEAIVSKVFDTLNSKIIVQKQN